MIASLRKMVNSKVAAVAALALCLTGTSAAATITGSIGWAGLASFDGPNLANASTITFLPAGLIAGRINSVTGGFADCTDDQCVEEGYTPTYNPNPFFLSFAGLPYTQFFTIDSKGTPGRYVFEVTQAEVTSALPGDDDLAIRLNGIFHDTLLNETATARATLSISKEGDSINYAVNFQTPGQFNLVPEPATFTFMGGGALLLGWAIRRKQKKA